MDIYIIWIYIYIYIEIECSFNGEEIGDIM